MSVENNPEFPLFQVKIGMYERQWLPVEQAGALRVSSESIRVGIGENVLEEDGRERPITDDEYDRIVDPSNEVSVPPEVVDQVSSSLELYNPEGELMYRTLEGIEKETELDPFSIQLALGKVARVSILTTQEKPRRNLYTLADRKLGWRERVEKLRLELLRI